MKKSVKKKVLISSLIGLVVLLILGFALLQTNQSVLIYKGNVVQPPQAGTFDFAGTKGTYETPFLGSISSGSPYDLDDYNSVLRIPTRDSTSITNTIDSSGNYIKIYSYLTDEDSSNENYIKTKTKLQEGTLLVTMTYDLYSYYSNEGYITFVVGKNKYSFATPSGSGNRWYLSGSKTISIDVKDGDEIELSIYGSGNTGKFSTKGTLDANFIPSIISTPEDNNDDSTQGEEQQADTQPQPQSTETEETPFYVYFIPVSILGLLALIIWQRIKNPEGNK